MAGYTSRIFLSLTIPSIFGLLSILWLLKRRNYCSGSKALAERQNVAEIPSSQDKSYDLMKVASQDSGCTERKVNAEMQLKEEQGTSGSEVHACNGVVPNGISKLKLKSVTGIPHENGHICSESIPNGCTRDNHIEKEDSKLELTNRIKALSLKDEASASGKVECTVQLIKQKFFNMDICSADVNSLEDESYVSLSTVTIEPSAQDVVDINAVSSGVVNVDIHDSSSALQPAKECNIDAVLLPLNDKSLTVDPECTTAESDSLTESTNESCTEGAPTDLHEIFPDDGFVPSELQTDMLESPGASKYCDSVGSVDSGKGASENQFGIENPLYYMVYEFEIFPEECGRLIGKLGHHVQYIKKHTNADILIKPHPYLTDLKLCSVTGTEAAINAALKLIRKRFPIEKFPAVTLAQINSLPVELQCPETLKLSLPDGVAFEGMLCATVSAGHFFLQQPTHPTFHSLLPLTSAMTALYSQLQTPTIQHLVKGNVCAASLASGWFRAEVDEVFEESEECRLKFLDYGGYAVVPQSSVRQIKYDYMLVPFQATECYLGSVTSIDDSGWSKEATSAFEELAQGQILQGCIVGYAENRIPLVHLYKITGATSVFINQELVRAGVAKWLTIPAQ